MPLTFVDEAELNTMLGAGKRVVADFFATWCQPCELLLPELEKLESAWGEEVEFVKINVDENPGLTLNLGIVSIPTVIHFADGNEVERNVGFAKADDLEANLGLEDRS